MAAIGRGFEIGGGKVKRAFNAGGKFLKAGTPLEAAVIMGWPTANRNALIDKKYIEVWPKGSVTTPLGSVGPGVERHIVPLGAGQYNVVEGKLLNGKPLKKSAAMALAGLESERKTKRKNH